MTTTLSKNRVWDTSRCSLRENSQPSIVVIHQRVSQHPCPRRITNVACLASDAKDTTGQHEEDETGENAFVGRDTCVPLNDLESDIYRYLLVAPWISLQTAEGRG